MLSGELIIQTLVSVLQTNAALVQSVNGDPNRIRGFFYLNGVEPKLAEAIYKMEPPAVLICYLGVQGGNFDGMTIFKHRCAVYIRSANQAGNVDPIGPVGMWSLLCNEPVTVPGYSTTLGIRNTQILPGQLDLVDVPSFQMAQDEDLMDYGIGTFVFPEIGDN